jgi:hypothetical protein
MITGWKLFSIITAYAAVAAGAAAVGSMLRHRAKGKPARRPGLWLWVHRVAGYAFFGVVAAMAVAMLARLPGYGEVFSTRVGWHVAEGFALTAAVISKWLVVRVFRSQLSMAPTLGLTIFALIFSMVNFTATVDVLMAAAGPPALTREVAVAQDVAAEKCTRCHSLKRVFARDRAPGEWPAVVAAMQARKPGWISRADAAKIIFGLSRDYGPPVTGAFR